MGEKKHSRAREKHEATYVNKNNQVTRRKVGEKTSMAESKYTAQYFPSKKKIKTKHEGEEKTREWHRKLLQSERPKFKSANFLISEQDADMSVCMSYCGYSDREEKKKKVTKLFF